MNRKRGFTLIELLVVIAIIAVLMAVLMPSLTRVRKQARAVACQARLKSWGLFFNFYTSDHDGRFNQGHNIGGGRGLWPVALRPYYQGQFDLLLCPDATREVFAGLPGAFNATSREFPAPGGGTETLIFSYGINNWTNYMTSDRGARLEEWFWKSTRTSTHKDQIPVFGDGTWHDAWPRHTDSPPPTDISVGSGNFGTTDEMQQFAIPRHANGTINMLFMDWSARKVGLKELWTLKWHRAFDTSGPWTTAGLAQPEDWPRWMRRFSDY
ncbi:MAG: type II secretion system protein [Planctomycetes bacterium]|nr:type II secretion system protein [Planctomycetota bacterium]